MISFVRALSDGEIRSSYLNLTDVEGRTYGSDFPPSLTHLVVVDQRGRRTRAEKHHGNQVWGTLKYWYAANRPAAGDEVVVAFDANERIDARAVLHLELLQPIQADDVEEGPPDGAGIVAPLTPGEDVAASSDGPADDSSVAAQAHMATPRRDELLRRVVRDTRLSRSIKLLHQYECQVCGETIPLPGGARYAEAHHLRPLGAPHAGPDVGPNVIVVCPNHHAMLDFGAMPLRLSQVRTKPGHSISSEFINYHNMTIASAACLTAHEADATR